MPTRRDFFKLVGMAAVATSLTETEFAQTANPSDQTNISGSNSLRTHAAARGLLVGCCVVPQKFKPEPLYASTVAEQANILVAEAAMKWRALRPAPDSFDFGPADELLAFTQAHGQKLRGHNLCWHEALPWWFGGTVNKENARQFLIQHIQTVAGRYAGKIHSWDVVNEAIDTKSGRPDGLRKTPWLEFIGPDYLELAYRTARQADPHALLTYNDYAIENNSSDQSAKRDRVMQLVRDFKVRGIPIDAVGVQSHLSATDPLPGSALQSFVRELGKMNLQVVVTEMDVNDCKLEGSVEQRDATVAKVYSKYAAMMLAEPNVTAFLTWGITDRYTWLDRSKWARPDGRPQRCLPLDENYHGTPAFFALRDAIDTCAARG